MYEEIIKAEIIKDTKSIITSWNPSSIINLIQVPTTIQKTSTYYYTTYDSRGRPYTNSFRTTYYNDIVSQTKTSTSIGCDPKYDVIDVYNIKITVPGDKEYILLTEKTFAFEVNEIIKSLKTIKIQTSLFGNSYITLKDGSVIYIRDTNYKSPLFAIGCMIATVFILIPILSHGIYYIQRE